MMQPPRRALRWLAILTVLVSCVGCDQATKRLAQSQLKGREPLSYLGNVVRLEYAENPGAFLGLGGQLSAQTRWVLLTLMNSLLAGSIAVVLLLHWRMSLLQLLAGTLLLAGALGNLLDRLKFDGLVIDFLNLGVGPLRTGIFNVADVAISTGAVLLLLVVRNAPPPLAAVDKP